MYIKDLGEKRIISDIIKPLINPINSNNLAGDDCAIISLKNSNKLNMSTDRIPSDLISYKLGLINHKELGEYLTILNISDVFAGGGTPIGVLLNFAFPNDFKISDMKEIFEGCKEVCDKYSAQIYGGDLSSSNELNLSATSFGEVEEDYAIFRSGSKAGHYIYATDEIGLTPSAFKYFLEMKDKTLVLTSDEEELLKSQFKNLKINTDLYYFLKDNKIEVQGMDNTDGIAQSLLEQAEINKLEYRIFAENLKINNISYKISETIGIDIFELVLGAGANFSLTGTISKDDYNNHRKELENKGMYIIGECFDLLDDNFLTMQKNNNIEKLQIPGWNYFS